CLKVIPDDGLQFSASYDSSRFTSAMVTRLLEHFLVLLTDIAAHPDKRLREYSLLSVSERQKILVDWNASQAALPYERGFQQLFEEQVARTPDAIAFTCADESLTYQQLNTQVNQYAHHLQELKIGPECVVALQARRDIHFWITMLGILKAGGVYLPLNLRDSPKSIAQVLAQSNVGLLLIDEEFLPELEAAYQQLPGEQFPRFLTLDELGRDGRPATNPLPRSLSRNLAYILYTSGSTGLPKGAMVEHCGMLNHLYEKTKDIQLGPGDRLAQNASQSFDVSVWQVLAPLLIGGGVHIVKDEISLHPLRLLEHVEEHAITLLQMVPSMLRGILDEIDSREHKPELRTLRWIIPTGEALPTELCRRWLRLYPHIPLLNTYGSTECSDDQCHYPIAQIKPDEDPLPIMPIGFPIANMRMYVLDSHLQLVPQGLTGELYIAGIGVGRGYYKNPTQTAEVFVPHPFASEPGERLYKTGDKVRWRMDGSLEFLRRVDYPIKLRGVRIEPGEIEAALSRHSLVQEAKVLIREDVPGFQRLVAYMVLQKTGHDLSGVQEPHILFREFLKQELPTWKIPSVFVLLEAFPLNANGKLDYRALPVPVEADVSDAENDDAPRTVVEEIVASYFATVLGKEKVGIHANFFDLGGHSLLATQVIARLCATFRVDIPFPAFFEHSTAAEVAQTLLAYEPVPGQIEKIATALKIIQGMSAEEKQRLLEQSAKKGGHQA
ncbi:MAG TPA: non-ribosomal peptide synthetase, partial [Ktedonobacteraceae bacterium]|nr:non-ribosomal peptide synthetase [Ktedonobacteraceae bacterium]